MAPNFQNGKIYCLRVRNDGDKIVYVGSTVRPLSERMGEHRHGVKKNPEWKIYKLLAEVGLDNVYIELLQAFPCNNREELNAEEGRHMRIHRTTIEGANAKIAGRTDQDYRAENREALKAKCKAYHTSNRDHLNAKSTAYYAAHRDTLTAQAREYYDAHRETMKEKSAVYHATHVDAMIAYRREHHAANRDAHNARSAAYHAAHREQANEKRKALQAAMTPDQRLAKNRLAKEKYDMRKAAGTIKALTPEQRLVKTQRARERNAARHAAAVNVAEPAVPDNAE